MSKTIIWFQKCYMATECFGRIQTLNSPQDMPATATPVPAPHAAPPSLPSGGSDGFQQHRCVAEPSNLMHPRSARLPLDTKHPRENTKLLGFVGHTPGENPKIHIFAIRITNERIKLTTFLTISYITFNTTSEYNIYYYNSGM